MKETKRINKIIVGVGSFVIIVIGLSVGVYMSGTHNVIEGDLEPSTIINLENVGKGEADLITNGGNYIENQVVAVADSKREAKKIAEQIGGELLSYDNQVATIQIGMTVEEMMQKLEEDPSLPKVYPNYQGYSN